MGQSVARRPGARIRKPVDDEVAFSVFNTACGWIAVAGRDQTVHQLRLGYNDPVALRSDLQQAGMASEADWFPELREKLRAYASGQPVSFASVRCALPVLTEFQTRVIDFVKRIPYGQVLSYGDVAAAVSYPGAARAVGTVMSSNRIPIIIPCHRVVAAGGKLGGYSAPQGIELKKWLLELEQAQLPRRTRLVEV